MWNTSSLISFNLFLCFCIAGGTLLFNSLHNKNLSAKLSAIFFFLFLFIFMGFRADSVGTDSLNYANMYFYISQMSFAQIIHIPVEQGFFLFCYLLSFISPNYPLLFAVSGAVFCASLIYFLYTENKTYLGLSLLVFIALNGFGIYMSALRQSVAFALLIISLPSLVNKHWIKFVILVFLATSFHTSACIFLLMIPLSFVPFNKKVLSSVIMGIFLLIPFRYELLNWATQIFPQYNHYTDYLSSSYLGQIQDFNLGYLVASVLKGIIIITPWTTGFLKEITKSRHLNLLAWLSIFSLLFIILSLETRIFNRLEMYFLLFACVLYTKSLAWLRQQHLHQKFFFYLLITLMPLFFYRILLFWKDPIWDYAFFWQ